MGNATQTVQIIHHFRTISKVMKGHLNSTKAITKLDIQLTKLF